jgi:hypothetical protein
LPTPVLADNEQVLVPLDPLAGSQPLEQRSVESTRRLHVDVFDDGVLPEAGVAQAGYEPLVVALGGFTVDQQREALLEAERGNVWLLAQLLQRLGHAAEPERGQALLGWMFEHCSPLFSSSAGLLHPWQRPSVVVAVAADVAVPDRRGLRRRFVGFVELVLQDRSDGAVGGGADVVARRQAASTRAVP